MLDCSRENTLQGGPTNHTFLVDLLEPAVEAVGAPAVFDRKREFHMTLALARGQAPPPGTCCAVLCCCTFVAVSFRPYIFYLFVFSTRARTRTRSVYGAAGCVIDPGPEKVTVAMMGGFVSGGYRWVGWCPLYSATQ